MLPRHTAGKHDVGFVIIPIPVAVLRVRCVGNNASGSLDPDNVGAGQILQGGCARYRQAGIPAEDVQFLVILGSVSPATQPDQGDQIKLSNTPWHQVRTIPEIDPAGATAKCQCYVIEDPE